MTATRRQAREWAIQMLTAADLNPPADVAAFIADFWSQLQTLDADEGGVDEAVRGKFKTFAEERVVGVLRDQKDIDATLAPLLEIRAFVLSERQSAFPRPSTMRRTAQHWCTHGLSRIAWAM